MARLPDETATEALIDLAQALADGGHSAPNPPSLDRADVSAKHLVGRIDGAAWWDSTSGGVKLVDANLAGASLRNANLSAADLSGADLAEAMCSGIVLAGARLEGAKFRAADLVGGDLTGVDSGQADFAAALLEDAKLSGARLRFAIFDDAVMDGADLSDADLWGAKLARVAAERTCFRHARLDEAQLASADLGQADFTGATLRRAKLAGARLRGAELRGAILDGADCSGTDFSAAVLPHVSLTSCTLRHARFAGAWLERTRMRAHQLGGATGEEAAGEFEAAVDSYIVLEQNFRSLGVAEDASWAFRRRRRMGKRLAAQRTQAAWSAHNAGGAVQAGLHWFTDIASEWLCDYGESVPRVLRALVVTLLAFAALYWLTGSLVARADMPGAAGRHFSVIDYLLFSLDSMTTVGTSEVELRPSGQFGVLLSSVQTVIGTVLLGLFGFVLGVRMRN